MAGGLAIDQGIELLCGLADPFSFVLAHAGDVASIVLLGFLPDGEEGLQRLRLLAAERLVTDPVTTGDHVQATGGSQGLGALLLDQPDGRFPGQRCIHLTGGGSQLFALDQYIASELDMPVLLARDPMSCAALGAGHLADNIELLHRIGKSSFLREEDEE